jgi:hypothetical protein
VPTREGQGTVWVVNTVGILGPTGTPPVSWVDFFTIKPKLTLPGDSGGPVVYPTLYGPLVAGMHLGGYGQLLSANGYSVEELVDADLFVLSYIFQQRVTPDVAIAPYQCPPVTVEGAPATAGSIAANKLSSGLPAPLVYNGSAHPATSSIRITDPAAFTSGSVFAQTPQSLTSSFTTHFRFYLHGSTTPVPADGIA